MALRARVLTAVVGIPLVFAALWAGGAWWAGLAAVVALLGWIEYTRLCYLSAWGGAAVLAAGGLLLALAAAGDGRLAAGVLAGWAAVLLLAGLLPLLRPPGQASRTGAALLLGPAYLAVPMGMLARWRVEHSAWSVLAFLLVIWANDIAAYFVGSAIGRHKLAPRTSPGKSWEGAIAGLIAGAGVGAAAAPLLVLSPVLGATFGGLVTIAAQLGDLFESAMKRRAGVKDSGALLPGHGGVLDRFDGILVAAPIGYALLRLGSGPG